MKGPIIAIAAAAAPIAIARTAATPRKLRSHPKPTRRPARTARPSALWRWDVHPPRFSIRAKQSDLTFSEDVPENKRPAAIYAPRTGKASLRQTASSKRKLLKNCRAGAIVSVLAIGNGYPRINYKGTVGYIKTACLKFYGDSESTAQGVLSYKGNTGGGTTVNVRNMPMGDSAKAAGWRAGTEAAILSHENGRYEIKTNGMHGYVMEQLVAEK